MTSTPVPTPPGIACSRRASEEPKKKRTVVNLAVRTATIVTLGPLIVAIGLHSNFGVTCLICIGCAIGGLEWGGLKRHLKVSLLLLLTPSGHTAEKSLTSTGTVDTEVEEYAVPAAPITLYVLLKYLSWGVFAWSAYYGGAQGVMMTLWLYTIGMATVTLGMHDRLAQAVDGFWHGPSTAGAAAAANERCGGSIEKATETSSSLSSSSRGLGRCGAHPPQGATAQFLATEQRAKAQSPLADRVLDVCLDVFGLVWVSAFVSVTLLYDTPYMGKPWILSTLLANFANDIFALVAGRTLSAIRSTMCESDDLATPTGAARRGRLTSLLLAGPHALSPSISPNKSVEGAVAGIVANTVGFALCMHMCYGMFFPPPPPELVHPLFQSTLFWLLVGALLGVLGVLGDLLESLLKRVARVKDAGFIVPGHGGVLDRFDGLLLVFPVMFCIAHAVLAMTRYLVLSAVV